MSNSTGSDVQRPIKDSAVILGNYYGAGTGFDGNVFDTDGCSPTLLASNFKGNVPKVIVNGSSKTGQSVR